MSKSMWRTFRSLDSDHQELAKSLENMGVSVSDILPSFSVPETIIRRREATANERAGRAEGRVIHLTKKFGKLVREKGGCLISALVFPSSKKPFSLRAVVNGMGGPKREA